MKNNFLKYRHLIDFHDFYAQFRVEHPDNQSFSHSEHELEYSI